MPEQTLSQKLDAFFEMGGADIAVPSVITENINKKFELRPYQEEALSRLIYYIESYKNRVKPTHLLFQMATGSGKTLIMASNILYLYTLGYRNFLFFVNSSNIIEKTKDNFLNSASIKYLFDDSITINDKKVVVNQQYNFQYTNDENINIVFTTIQGLHSNLTTPRENSLTFEDFEDKKIVLISDEAHHINALTRNNMTQEELDIQGTWENTVQRIFSANKENILLEFTATMDMDNPNILDKYSQKLLFDYSLRQFREDKYSKDVKVLETDTDNLTRALQAMILSQYRLKVAQDKKVFLKPVILFKSKTISASEEFEEAFHEFVSTIKATDIQKVASKNNGVLAKAFHYFKENNIDLESLVLELQEDFSPEKCISVNSKNESDEKQVLVNTLEDENNQIRAIFAVDKLNEGWDVLNLFDIVRLYDTRDARSGRVGKTTMSEAQLIGRGARYYPFSLNAEQDKHKRKYDEDISNSLRILEELYYHSAYNPKYISELTQALKETGIKAQLEEEQELTLKKSFKESDFWKTGILYLNNKEKNLNKNKSSFEDYNIKTSYKYNLHTGYTRETIVFESQVESLAPDKSKTLKLLELGSNVIRKAMDKNEFYRLSNLKKYTPNIKSLDSVPSFFEQIEVEIHGSNGFIENMTQDEKLDIALEILREIQGQIESDNEEYIGTYEFKAKGVSEIFEDKVLKIATDDTSDAQFGKSMQYSQDPLFNLDILDNDWYAYKDNFGTSEEKYFVKFIDNAYKELKNKYDEIFLVRNANAFKLYNFEDGRVFEPDFVLFLNNKKDDKKLYLQLFVEPKGQQLFSLDSWKQDFLLELGDRAKPEIIYNDREYTLVGLPFYNEEMTKQEFSKVFNEIT